MADKHGLHLERGKDDGESKLMDAIFDGDHFAKEAAWKTLYSRYFSRLVESLSGKVKRDIAEEIVQHAFTKAFQSIKNFQRGSSFYTWVYSIARNLFIDEYRRTQRRKIDSLTLESGEDGAQILPDKNPGQDVRLIEQEDIMRVRAAIAQLPPTFAEIIRLRDLEEHSYAEIATILGIPLGTVMSRIFYGRKALNLLLSETDAAEERAEDSVAEVVENKPQPLGAHPVEEATDDDERLYKEFLAFLEAEGKRLHAARVAAELKVADVRARLDEAI